VEHPPDDRDSYSSTSRLNVSTFCGIRWECVGWVQWWNRLRVSRQVNEWKTHQMPMAVAQSLGCRPRAAEQGRNHVPLKSRHTHQQVTASPFSHSQIVYLHSYIKTASPSQLNGQPARLWSPWSAPQQPLALSQLHRVQPLCYPNLMVFWQQPSDCYGLDSSKTPATTRATQAT